MKPAKPFLASPRQPGWARNTRLRALTVSGVAAGLTAGLALAWSPAEAAITQTSSCVDGGGVRWTSRAIWGGVYQAADGAQRVSVDYAGWTTSKAGTVPTDSSVRTYDSAGALVQSLPWTGGMDYGAGSVYKVRNPMNPVSAPGRAKVTVTLGVDGDGLGNCTMTFTQPQTVSPTALAGSPTSALDLSPNPRLATSLQGYSIQEGGTGLQRVSVTDHVAATWAARATSTGTTTRIREPDVAVKAGQTYSFASDVKADAGAKAQITVSWYSQSGTWLSWSGGTAQSVSQSTWTRVAATLPVPANATIAQTVVNVVGTPTSAAVTVTQHDVRAPVTGTSSPTPTATPTQTSTPTPTATPTSSPTSGTITNLPGQPAITAYGSGSAVTPFAHRGALIIAGRDNYADQPVKDASAAGATVLVYFDAVIDNPYGRYHAMLDNASECGPATSRWPGNYQANTWGYLNDFRVGSVLQSKLKCVLEKMVAENPHMGGFFADDLGSRSWFPNFSWDSWGTTNQQAYRDGAVAMAQTLHAVAAEHGLMLMVNGTWAAGSLASSGGGYPNMSSHGLSLADGGYIEHHSTSELAYWTAYARGQWATAPGAVGRGKPFMYVQANDAGTRDAYDSAGVFAFLSAQVDYSTASVWGSFHGTGLPSRVAR